MALVRIFLMYPAGIGKTWHMSEDGREGEPFPDEKMAITAARTRAKLLKAAGREVQIRQETADGTWRVISD